VPQFSGLLDPRCIILDLKGRRKREIIEELVAPLEICGELPDSEEAVRELMEREKAGSTGIGKGVAIPHRLLRGLEKPLVVFGRKVRGVDFDAADAKPVKIFFLILGPQDEKGEHLKLLSKLARFLHEDAFLLRLLEAKLPEDVLDAFRKAEAV